MENIKHYQLMRLETIIQNAGMPSVVSKWNWSADFAFRVERVSGGYAYGTALKKGAEYMRSRGEYKYKLHETFFLIQSEQEIRTGAESSFLEKKAESCGSPEAASASREMPEGVLSRSCTDCMLMRSGECFGTAEPCEDFKRAHNFEPWEKSGWAHSMQGGMDRYRNLCREAG